MLAHRRRRWPNIETALGERLVFAGLALAGISVQDSGDDSVSLIR